ncbi:hypothetical protein V6N13_004353 [Hibiscus sabdariffa]
MNVFPVEAYQINTGGVIYERGLIGTYQNWCETMSTYPRTQIPFSASTKTDVEWRISFWKWIEFYDHKAV